MLESQKNERKQQQNWQPKPIQAFAWYTPLGGGVESHPSLTPLRPRHLPRQEGAECGAYSA